ESPTRLVFCLREDGLGKRGRLNFEAGQFADTGEFGGVHVFAKEYSAMLKQGATLPSLGTTGDLVPRDDQVARRQMLKAKRWPIESSRAWRWARSSHKNGAKPRRRWRTPASPHPLPYCRRRSEQCKARRGRPSCHRPSLFQRLPSSATFL